MDISHQLLFNNGASSIHFARRKNCRLNAAMSGRVINNQCRHCIRAYYYSRINLKCDKFAFLIGYFVTLRYHQLLKQYKTAIVVVVFLFFFCCFFFVFFFFVFLLLLFLFFLFLFF